MNQKTLLYVDIETYSSVDLLKCGAYAYAESEDFEILLFAYAWGDNPVEVIDLKSGQDLPPSLIDPLFDPNVKKSAFNANFERVCLGSHFGKTLPPDQWTCTAVLSNELGLPGNLGGCGEALQLESHKKKAQIGKALIQYFCKPCKPTKTNGQRTRNLPEHDLEKWTAFMEYNRQDVEAERSIRGILTTSSLKESEQELWELDQIINDRGVQVDLTLAQKASDFDDLTKEKLLQEAKYITGLENPKSDAQLKKWITLRTEMEVPSLNKEVIPELVSKITDKSVLDMLNLRSRLAKSSLSKYKAMGRVACSDGRARGVTQFYGANRTGRWAGRLIQMQNLPQNKMPYTDLDCARTLLKLGDFEVLNLLFLNVPDTLSQLIRTAFIPKEGHRFIVADFSAIEARVLAWLASEKWRQDVFATHGKIYEASAEQMFGLPSGSIKKGDPMRQKGKIAELALGYGGSIGALTAMGALKMGLEESELMPLVKSWRNANKAITKFWWDSDNAAKTAIEDRVISHLPYGMGFYISGAFLKCRLPSGRELSYAYPAVVDDQITYMGGVNKKWERISSYGPKLVENIVQAVARDCLAEAMLRLEKAGFQIVFHVHDEVICEVPVGVSSTEEVNQIMGQDIPWARGLLLNAEAYECDYYIKD